MLKVFHCPSDEWRQSNASLLHRAFKSFRLAAPSSSPWFQSHTNPLTYTEKMTIFLIASALSWFFIPSLEVTLFKHKKPLHCWQGDMRWSQGKWICIERLAWIRLLHSVFLMLSVGLHPFSLLPTMSLGPHCCITTLNLSVSQPSRIGRLFDWPSHPNLRVQGAIGILLRAHFAR